LNNNFFYKKITTMASQLEESLEGPLFDALADPTRRRVIRLLGSGPWRAGQLAEATGVPAAAMSKQLRLLLEAGVVAAERSPKDARVRVFRLRPESMTPVRRWLDRLQSEWERNLTALKAHVATEEER
jgi:DNA-binding transcriptional ArsR family regulator